MSLVYIGKKVPKGLRQVGLGMNLGNGLWVFSVEPIPPTVGTATANSADAVTFALVTDDAKRPAPRKRKAKKGGRRG